MTEVLFYQKPGGTGNAKQNKLLAELESCSRAMAGEPACELSPSTAPSYGVSQSRWQ
ncbi:MAG: hypothetical protein WBG92_03940 [Thiohalocapsa sp.]